MGRSRTPWLVVSRLTNLGLGVLGCLLMTACAAKEVPPTVNSAHPTLDPAEVFAAELSRELSRVNEYFGIPLDARFAVEARTPDQVSFAAGAYLTPSDWQRLLPFEQVLKLDGSVGHCADRLTRGEVFEYLWDDCSFTFSKPVFTMVVYQVVEMRMAELCRFPMTIERVEGCKDLLDRFESLRYDRTPVLQLSQLHDFFHMFGPMAGAFSTAGMPSLDALNDKIGFYLMKGSGPFEAYHKFITNAAGVLDNREHEKLGAGGR